MLIGGALAAGSLALVALHFSWQAQIAIYGVFGLGFYLLHSCIQVHVTDLSQTARGAAASLHSSSFYLGQAIGPIIYGFGFAHGGPEPTIFLGAVVVLAVGIALRSRMLRTRGPATCMNRTLNIVSFLVFASALSVRAIDPVVPQIAADFSISTTTAALLAAGFAAYGLAQPVLGPMADAFGKARIMIACLLLLAVSSFLSAVVTDFWLLFVLRILAGAACGGSFPVGMALISDFVPLAQRQVMIGRLLTRHHLGQPAGRRGGRHRRRRHPLARHVRHSRRHQHRGAAARLFRPARSAADPAAAARHPLGADAQPRHLRDPHRPHLLRDGRARSAVSVRHLSLCRGAADKGRRAARDRSRASWSRRLRSAAWSIR